MSRASDYIPGRPHIATIWRWIAKGVRGIKLEVVRVGGRTMVTPEAIETFLSRLNATDSPTPQFTPSQRQRMSEAARRELEKLGI